MNQSPNSREFHYFVTKPLEDVLGSPLRSVHYAVLVSDYPDFNIDIPNDSGACQRIYLKFDAGIVELTWYGNSAFYDEHISYNLITRPLPDQSGATDGTGIYSEDCEWRYGLIDAANAVHWTNAVDTPLLAITVWGYEIKKGLSPHAITFHFPSAEVVIACGYTTNEPMGYDIGDGDEILVFSIEEWRRTDPAASGLFFPIQPIWHLP